MPIEAAARRRLRHRAPPAPARPLTPARERRLPEGQPCPNCGPRTPPRRCSARPAATTSPPAACPGRRAGAPTGRRRSPTMRPPRRCASARPGEAAEPPRWTRRALRRRPSAGRLGGRGVDRPGLVRGPGEPGPLPSPGLPEVVPLRPTSLLIGRKSASRNIHPEIDCEPDSGASRRQAQLTTDGSRWCVEDLESANGTFVGAASRPAARRSDPGRGQARARAGRSGLCRRLDPDRHPRRDRRGEGQPRLRPAPARGRTAPGGAPSGLAVRCGVRTASVHDANDVE